jgi:predicted glycosyltransferase
MKHGNETAAACHALCIPSCNAIIKPICCACDESSARGSAHLMTGIMLNDDLKECCEQQLTV